MRIRTMMGLAAGAAALAALGLATAAVAQELAKPAAERTGRGRVLGIPYTLRAADWAALGRRAGEPARAALATLPRAEGLGQRLGTSGAAAVAGLAERGQEALWDVRALAERGAERGREALAAVRERTPVAR